MTEKLYYKDKSIIVFSAEILDLQFSDDFILIELNRTAFFPEGGGQPADKGFINSFEVIEVCEKDGIIIHKIKNQSNALKVGQTVEGKIDSHFRFVMMQSHSGEHLVSGVAHNLYGVDNVGFHIDENYIMTVDFNKKLSNEDISEIERQANRFIYENIPINCYDVSCIDAEKLDYRSKLEFEDQLRIVEIEDIDLCACCALHVDFTGEIGLIKILSCISHRGGVRITVICGETALNDYFMKHYHLLKISAALCSKCEETFQAVERLKLLNYNLSNEIKQLKSKHLKYIADSFSIDEKVIFLDNEMPMDELRELVNLLGKKAEKIAFAFSGSDSSVYSYCIFSEKLDLLKFSGDFNSRFNGKGGGKGNIIQGKVEAEFKKIETFIKEFAVTDYENA